MKTGWRILASLCFGLGFVLAFGGVKRSGPTASITQKSAFLEPLIGKDRCKQESLPFEAEGGVGKCSVPGSGESESRGLRSRSLTIDEKWNQFTVLFGEDLKPEFSESGRLVSIRSLGTQMGIKGVPGFRTQDVQGVTTRAKGVLAAARDLLKIHSEWPLENPIVQTGPYSAQIFFNESHQGMSLAPVGSVKIELGSQGELIALYSDYTPHLQVTNTAQLEPQKRRSLIWVLNDREGRIAYESNHQGRQTITDAETGSVLFSRDLRQY